MKKGRRPTTRWPCVNLGVLYNNGEGVKQDYTQARQWYEKAAAAGDAGAMVNLGYLYGHGDGVKQDYTQARHWNEKGCRGRR